MMRKFNLYVLRLAQVTIAGWCIIESRGWSSAKKRAYLAKDKPFYYLIFNKKFSNQES